MAKKYLGIRLSEEQIENLEWMKLFMGAKSITEVIRKAIDFTFVFFNERLTVEKAVKPHALKMLIESPEYRRITPIAEILKEIHQIRRELGI